MFEADGVRAITYLSPFFSNLTSFGYPDCLYNEADKKGYFLKDKDGNSYSIYSGSIQFAMVDFSNPDAVDWFKRVIKDYLVKEAHSSGWM